MYQAPSRDYPWKRWVWSFAPKSKPDWVQRPQCPSVRLILDWRICFLGCMTEIVGHEECLDDYREIYLSLCPFTLIHITIPRHA